MSFSPQLNSGLWCWLAAGREGKGGRVGREGEECRVVWCGVPCPASIVGEGKKEGRVGLGWVITVSVCGKEGCA